MEGFSLPPYVILTANAPVYSTKGDYVTPCLRWTTEKSTGILNLSGLSFSHESETVVMPADLGKTISTYNATDTAVDDDTAPMPSTQVREWSRAANKSGWVYLTNKELATSTPQVGEVWEATFSAKTVSGSGGTMLFRFRQCDETGAVTSTDASTSDSVALTNDGAWHTYKLYVTVNADAYENYGEIVPRFGWASSNTAGTVRVNGLTVRKVGDQWCEALGANGFTAIDGITVETVDSTNSPIAYTNTLKLTNTSDETVTIKADNAQFSQWQAGKKWKISFWANTPVDQSVKFCYGSSSYGTVNTNGQWKLYSYQFSFTTSNLSVANVAFELPAGASVYVNAPSIVPGSVVRANESYQNSAALKNITIKTGSATFNTAIEYDTDVNHYAYSRVKHYIINGKAYSYEYDEAGNISKIQSPDGSWDSYEYDALNQLKAEHYSLPCVKGGAEGEAEVEGLSYDTIEYTYDTRGNILSKIYLLGETVVADNQYTYADSVWKDRLTEYNNVEITYDTIGNPLSWHDGSTMSWQKGRQLASYTKDGVETAFTYDVDGIRRSKTTNGVKTEYNVYDGELRSITSGSNTMRFVYGNGLSSVIFNGTEYWYVFNAQGDVIGLIDASGSYVVQYTYDAWGKNISQTDSDLARLNPFRYRGYIYDEETGLYYVSSRYYDPEIGRWLNADGQISGVGGDVRGYNQFAYCFNNPVNMDDPSGNWPKWLTGTLTVAAGAAQIAAGAALGAAVGWTGIGAVAAGVLLVAGSATVVQGVGQIVNDVTNSDVMFEGNALKYTAQEITRSVAGDDAANMVGTAYDLTVDVASIYATGYSIANFNPYDCCFIAGTAILASTGHKAIEKIRTGDMVWAENPETGRKELKEVVQTFVNETSELIHVRVNGEEIVTTPEHPFYIPQKGWTPSIELRAGDILVLQNGKYVVIEQVQHEILESPIKVYNFEVADFHTYYVGKSAVLVHNMCPKHTPDQQAVIEIAKEYKNGISRTDAEILVGWAKEYGLNYHVPMTHPNRSGIWSYTEHIKIFNIHIPIK